jgi:hypothetical protein
MNAATITVFLGTALAMGIITLGFLAYQHSIGMRNLLAPAAFVMIMFPVQYGIGNYWVVMQGQIDFLQLVGRDDAIQKTFLLALSAQFAFALGYMWYRGTTRVAAHEQRPTQPIIPIIITLYVVGYVARLVMIRMGVYSYLLSDLDTFQSQLGLVMALTKIERLCAYALIASLIAAYLNPDRRSYKTLALVLLLSELSINFIGGTKGATLLILLYVGLVAMSASWPGGSRARSHCAGWRWESSPGCSLRRGISHIASASMMVSSKRAT